MPQLPSSFQLRTAFRHVVSAASGVLPQQASVGLERRIRGYEESKKLAHSDGVIISFGKSGRTWLTVLLSRYFAKKFGLPEGSLMEFDSFHRSNPKIPVLFFSHDNYLKDHTGTDGKFANYAKVPVVLLVRDPRDTAISQYFQWKHRMNNRKKVINDYPLENVGIFEFVAGKQAGLPKIIDFMNAWAADIEKFPHLLMVKYEDLRADTAGELRRILAFFGQSPTEEELADAVNFASVENMRKMEQENAGKVMANTRLKPGNVNDPSSFKVRRAKVGGWRDYLTENEAEQVDRVVRADLSPVFGYR